MPAQTRASWEQSGGGFQALSRLLYPKQLDLVGMMRRAGVEFLAGTDTGGPYLFPGFSLHDELALLVQAGLTPLEALQAATLNPARFLGREKELGTVEKGKLADLVLLDADPLQDITHTRKISAVVLNGRLFDRKTLDVMLGQVEAAADK
jgi:imidazolonepropionase-like amidohydrolase